MVLEKQHFPLQHWLFLVINQKVLQRTLLGLAKELFMILADFPSKIRYVRFRPI